MIINAINSEVIKISKSDESARAEWT